MIFWQYLYLSIRLSSGLHFRIFSTGVQYWSTGISVSNWYPIGDEIILKCATSSLMQHRSIK